MYYKCRACGQEILFVKMESGKSMPVDAKPVKMVQVFDDGIGYMVSVYNPHWATCTQASKFRKPKQKER